MQQEKASEQVLFLNFTPDQKIWAYSKVDLEKIYRKIKKSQQELSFVMEEAKDLLLKKEDGSNGLEDSGISRGTTSDDTAHRIISERSFSYLQKLIKAEELIIDGLYSSVCKKCGNHISLERLLLIPETKFCHCCVM